MGNRSYLYINKKEEKDYFAFESNGSLPFFWVVLLSEKHIIPKTETWQFLTTCSEEKSEQFYKDENKSADLEISYTDFKDNSEKGFKFLEASYPNVIPLYTDFIEAIEKEFNNQDTLKIELIEYTWFYENINDFISDITNNIKGIKENNPELCSLFISHDLVAYGVGFPSISLIYFKELPSYKNALKDRTSYPKEHKEYTPFSYFSFLLSVLALLISFLFYYTIYKDFLKDGATTFLVITGVLNIAFTILHLFSIRDSIESYKRNIFEKPKEYGNSGSEFLWVWIIVLVIALGFSFVIYKGFLKERLNTMTLFLSTIDIGVIYFCVFQIIENFNYLRKKGKKTLHTTKYKRK